MAIPAEGKHFQTFHSPRGKGEAGSYEGLNSSSTVEYVGYTTPACPPAPSVKTEGEKKWLTHAGCLKGMGSVTTVDSKD